MLLFYAAIRSGEGERLRDPSLTIAQMSFRCWSARSSLAGRGRGAVFPIMMVVLMFGLYSLTPRQVRLMRTGVRAVRRRDGADGAQPASTGPR